MDKKLWNKLVNEEPLDAAEHIALEQALEAGDESLTAYYLSHVENPAPSLAWRSELNEQLKQIAPQPVRQGWKFWAWGGAITASAAACAFLLTVVMNSQQESANPVQIANNTSTTAVVENAPAPQSKDLGTVLISAHQADETQASLGWRAPRRSHNLTSGYSNW